MFAYRCVCLLKGPSASKLKTFGEASLDYAVTAVEVPSEYVVLNTSDDDDVLNDGKLLSKKKKSLKRTSKHGNLNIFSQMAHSFKNCLCLILPH